MLDGYDVATFFGGRGGGGVIGFIFGHISKLKYAHFLKKMGILQMGIFMNFQKNGHIANGHIFENYQKMEIL